jgi:hypothetical protein
MFQHNRTIKINENSYTYVKSYKSEMLKNLAQLFSDINVRYVISHGNLLEYERGQPIFQDDDLDIRACKLDIKKWESYCKVPSNQTNPKYNIRFDNRFHNIDRQKHNGIQCWLINFHFKDATEAFKKMNIHADIVFDSVTSKQWMDYAIDWEGLEEITYMDTTTYVPKKEDRVRLLKLNYGGKYIIPHKNIKL